MDRRRSPSQPNRPWLHGVMRNLACACAIANGRAAVLGEQNRRSARRSRHTPTSSCIACVFSARCRDAGYALPGAVSRRRGPASPRWPDAEGDRPRQGVAEGTIPRRHKEGTSTGCAPHLDERSGGDRRDAVVARRCSAALRRQSTPSGGFGATTPPASSARLTAIAVEIATIIRMEIRQAARRQVARGRYFAITFTASRSVCASSSIRVRLRYESARPARIRSAPARLRWSRGPTSARPRRPGSSLRSAWYVAVPLIAA